MVILKSARFGVLCPNNCVPQLESWEIQALHFNSSDLGTLGAMIAFPPVPSRRREEPWEDGVGLPRPKPDLVSALSLPGNGPEEPSNSHSRHHMQASQQLHMGWLFSCLPFVDAFYSWTLFCLFSVISLFSPSRFLFPPSLLLSSPPLLLSSLPLPSLLLSSPFLLLSFLRDMNEHSILQIVGVGSNTC